MCVYIKIYMCVCVFQVRLFKWAVVHTCSCTEVHVMMMNRISGVMVSVLA
jgi:hypothetical protein